MRVGSRAGPLGVRRPCVVWLTGLSGAGKTTIGSVLEQGLSLRGAHVTVLDGDALRRGLSRDLGFSDADRSEHVRRVGEVARLMVQAGLVVVATLISPFRADRAMVRAMFRPDEFIEVFVDVPLAVAEVRDPKGLYRRARAGEISRFTGIDSPYEPPLQPDVHVHGATTSAADAAEMIIARLALPGHRNGIGIGEGPPGTADRAWPAAPVPPEGGTEPHPDDEVVTLAKAAGRR